MDPIKQIHYSVPYNPNGVNLYGIADAHCGNVFCSEKELRAKVKQIAEEDNSLAMLVGDMLELTTKNSLGDIWSQHTTPWQQIELAADILMPIKNKIICADDGNHELRAYRYDGLLPMRNIMAHLGFNQEEIDAKYAGGAALVFLNMKGKTVGDNVTYSIYAKHGSGGGATIGAKANRLKNMKQEVIADIYIRAHDHEQMAFPSGTWVALGGRMNFIRHLHVNTGSWLGWGGYAVQFGFTPSVTGTPCIKLRPVHTMKETIKHASIEISN